MSQPDTPLIWTTKGNVPVESLKLAVRWEFTEKYVKLVETYADASGEVVKESAHVYDKLGVCASGAAANF